MSSSETHAQHNNNNTTHNTTSTAFSSSGPLSFTQVVGTARYFFLTMMPSNSLEKDLQSLSAFLSFRSGSGSESGRGAGRCLLLGRNRRSGCVAVRGSAREPESSSSLGEASSTSNSLRALDETSALIFSGPFAVFRQPEGQARIRLHQCRYSRLRRSSSQLGSARPSLARAAQRRRYIGLPHFPTG
jgi:hypothetical protein